MSAPPDVSAKTDTPEGIIIRSKGTNSADLPDYHELLEKGSQKEIDDEYLLERARVIEDTLQSFGAPGKVVEINSGPVITQFGVEPDYLVSRQGKKTRVKVSSIAKLDADLALALAARSIRIEAPVPGKGYVGIEVPNTETSLVSLRDIMDSDVFRRLKTKMRIALGQSVDGAPIAADLTAMPHMLIAGTTGSGKSVCVNAIITSLLLENTPDDLKFIMVDPKRVELTGYNGIPHLVTPVVVDLERIVGVLKWVTREMDERYKRFSQVGARNIVDYNSRLTANELKLPYLVVVIDELADLMMLAPDETEKLLTRLAQMARATGIHLIVSTQRPSVDVVTGLIKANFPARISFAVASSIDSRVILDQPGAEKLLGRGDMLYQSPDAAAPVRMQGVYVSDSEINRITRYWKMAGLNSGSATDAASGIAISKPSIDLTEAERQHIFSRSWHLVCHLNDIPKSGDYQALDMLGEKFFTLRGDDDQVRSFHNVCRHRASRLAYGASGNCGRRLVCPYHAWSYGLDGTLKAVPAWQGFEDLDLTRYGLVPLEQEIWHGFVFVRMAGGQPSIAEMFVPYEQEIAPHGFEKLEPQGRTTLRPRAVNWKNLSDNYGDGLHIPVAHRGLSRLFAASYTLEAKPWVDRMHGSITERPSSNWAERSYQTLLPLFNHLPEARRRVWSYYRLWPNLAFDVYPDQVDFMQFLPISPTETLIREIAYARPDTRREVRIARYLNWRINRQVNAEDTVLVAGVQSGMTSSSYVSGPLSRSEVCLAAFARRMRHAIPQAAFEQSAASNSRSVNIRG